MHGMSILNSTTAHINTVFGYREMKRKEEGGFGRMEIHCLDNKKRREDLEGMGLKGKHGQTLLRIQYLQK